MSPFAEEARRFAEKLKACATTRRPGWKDHPTTWNQITPGQRYELYRDVLKQGEDVAKYQYIFSTHQIEIGLYVTMLHDAVRELRKLLESNKDAIQETCGEAPYWDNKVASRVRFCIDAHYTSDRRVTQEWDDELIQELVDLMWEFQEATMPLLQRARQAAAERAAFDQRQRDKGKRAARQ